jgi:hypothetical protein
MHDVDLDEIRASARLANLQIDVVHRRARAGAGEQIAVSLTAMPSLAAASRFPGFGGPVQAWAGLAVLAWLPWLEAWQNALRFWSAVPLASPPRPVAANDSAQHRPDA